jgi:hypothetical protein
MYGALMPERARSHQIETESRVAFETALGSRFKYQVESAPEYGIDGTVEEFDASNQATGLRFYTQLKGTDDEDLSKSLAVSLKWDTVAYLRSQALPTLMVRYRAVDETLYARHSTGSTLVGHARVRASLAQFLRDATAQN